MEISSNSIISSFDIVAMYTSSDVKAAEILLERKISRNLDFVNGETGLEVGVIMNFIWVVQYVFLFFFFNSGFFRTNKWFYPWGPL